MEKVNFLKTKYFYLLCSVLLLILVLPHLAITNFGHWLLSAFFVLILIAAIYAIRHQSREFKIALVLTVFVIATDVLDVIYVNNSFIRFADAATTFLFIAFTVNVIIRDVLTHKLVTKDTVFGAMSVYFLIALLLD